MRHLGLILAVGLTVIFVFILGVFSFFPVQSPSVPAVATPPPVTEAQSFPAPPPVPDVAQIESELLQREAVYLAQIAQLEDVFEERQTTYEQQTRTLTEQVGIAQQQLNDLQRQEQTLQAQVMELQTSRNERVAQYENQLQQVQTQYSARFEELQAMIDDMSLRLAEANAQLGR